MSAPASAAPLVSSVAPAVLVDAVPLLSAAAASVAAAPLPAAINDAPAASAAPGKSAPPAPVAAPVLVAATAAEAKDEERPLPQPKKRRTALPVEPLRSLPADVASAPSPAATQDHNGSLPVYWIPRNLVADTVSGPLRKTASIGYMTLNSERALADALSHCSQLEELSLCSITGMVIADTLDRLTCASTLTHLTIKDCNVSQRSLLHFVQRCPCLEGVFLERAEFVPDRGVPIPSNALPPFALAKVHSPSLRTLVLTDTIVDPEDAIDFIERHPKLLSFHAVFTDTDARFFKSHVAQVLNMLAPRRAEMGNEPPFEREVASELARYHGKGLKRYCTFPRLNGVDLSSLPLFDAALDYARFLPSPQPEGAAAPAQQDESDDEEVEVQPRALAQEMNVNEMEEEAAAEATA